jgi:hypothetical protein
MRLLVGLTYLKHTYNLSDEEVCTLGGEPVISGLSKYFLWPLTPWC